MASLDNVTTDHSPAVAGPADAVNGLRSRGPGRRPSTIPEATNSSPAPKRRSSSFMTESSMEDRRRSLRASIDGLPQRPRGLESMPTTLENEPSLWLHAPLALAVVPAIVGVAFKGGAVFLTDLALLALTAFGLNYCVMAPWAWYQAAQTTLLTHTSTVDVVLDETIDDSYDTEGSGKISSKGREQNDQSAQEDSDQQGKTKDKEDASNQDEKEAALRELRLHEVLAFASCFAGPLFGAYVLHYIRFSLSHFGDEMISNVHLTLFVLGAEIRPTRHLMKMIQARTVHLQRIVREDPLVAETSEDNQAQVLDLVKRVDEMESALSNSVVAATPPPPEEDSASREITETVKKTQNALQTQVDALNRAVRRYEKRQSAQIMQTEARMQDLESRLRDALSLAAAAAKSSQQPSALAVFGEWLQSLILLPIQVLLMGLVYPLRVFNSVFEAILLRLGVVQTTKRRRPAPKNSVPGKLGRDRVATKMPVKKY